MAEKVLNRLAQMASENKGCNEMASVVKDLLGCTDYESRAVVVGFALVQAIKK